MTIAPNRPTHVLPAGVAQETIHEMAAVVRTLFGVGLQASRQAALASDALAAEIAAPAAPTVAATGVPVSPVSIPVPGIPVPEARVDGIAMPSIPLPDLAMPDVTMAEADEPAAGLDVPVLDDAVSEPEMPGIPMPGFTPDDLGSETDEVVVPAPIPLALVPDLAPSEEIGNERRAALLQELAFLDD